MKCATNNKMVLSAVLLGILIFISVILLSKKDNVSNDIDNNSTVNSDIILYYGDGCSHCKIVEDFIKENDIDKKVVFVRKEIFNNEQNRLDIQQKAKICNIDTNTIGVPFLWDGSRCIIGDKDVILFFKNKLDASN